MNIKICGGLNDTEKTLDGELPDKHQGFVPRVDDIIYFKNCRYKVYRVIIDYDLDEISVWVKDSID